MIAFKGRNGAMVYQPKKPHKWGMQVWFLADSRTAYCYNLDIYSGKRADNVDSGVGVTHATVMRMVQPCIGRGHHITSTIITHRRRSSRTCLRRDLEPVVPFV